MINIAEFFIKRPVFATVINVVISVLGFFCIYTNRIPIREYPNIEQQIVNVSMEYSGASVDVMESQIASKFEETLSSVEGLKNMRTVITQGNCDIQMTFGSSDDIDKAASAVESKLRRIKADLPENLRDPIISKVDPSAISAFTLSLSGGDYGSSELGDRMVRYVKTQIESIPGVASVTVPGQTGSPTTYAIDVFMRPDDMAALRVTPEDLYRALSTQSFVQPAGDVFIGAKTYRMTVRAGLTSATEFGQVIVKEKAGRIVRVQDVADVIIGTDEANQRVRYNGKVVSFCYVKIQPSANVIAISKALKSRLPEIQKSLPDKNLNIELIQDKSIQINASINRLYRTIVEAVILVALVILLFLKSFRSTIIPLVTIPVCLLSGFFIIYLFGFTLNIITLLAMLLAVGLVVDDAVVLLERFVENIDHGMTPMQACITGMNEIQFAVLGMTLTLVSVYLPISLLNSAWGKFFNEFALTLAGMVLVSGIVAFVLTPVMSASILKNSNNKTYKFIELFNKLFELIKTGYKKALKICLKNANIVFLISGIIVGLSAIIYTYFLPNIAEPEADKGVIYLDLSTSRSSLDTITPILEKIESIKNDPSVKGVASDFNSGSDKARIAIYLKDKLESRESVQVMTKKMKQKFDADMFDYMPHYYFPSSPLAEGSRFSVSVKASTSKSYDELEDIGNELAKLLGGMTEPYKTSNVQVSKTRPETTFNVVPNRDRAYLMGVRLDDVRNAIKWITRGNPPADRYERDGKQYPVRLWVSEDNRRDIEIVKKFFVKSSTKRTELGDEWELISLRDLVDIQEAKTRPLMNHEDNMRSFYIFSEFDKRNVDLISAYKAFETKALKKLPPGYTIKPGQSIRNLIEEGNNLLLMIVLALVFVYLVMAAQFNSFIDPLIVICTVPLAIACAIISLRIFPDGSLNAYSYIGILTLIGLITKHGILLVEFFNKKSETSNTLQKAALEAAVERFRPIIMTTLAMVLGAIPLILSKGSGYEGPRQVGIVIVGGLTFGTIMTILVVPCLCVLFRKFKVAKVIEAK